jgi:hypothetical protein
MGHRSHFAGRARLAGRSRIGGRSHIGGKADGFARVHASAGTPSAVRIAMQYVGSRNPTRTRGPWCGDFMNLIEHRAQRPGIKSRRAVDWRHYGHGSAPVAGAIVVFRGHVGRVIQRLGDKVQVISGNYGHKVGIGVYNVRSAIAYRMP